MFNHIREVILDTETTGLTDNDKIIEIACVEIINGIITNNNFHTYVNPEGVSVHPRAYEVHKISDEFLKDKPTFKEIYQDMIKFIGDSNIIAHNAKFDMRFINSQLNSVGEKSLNNKVIDTLILAKIRYPSGPNSLDALCARLKIDNRLRDKGHSAIVDCKLLAKVYHYIREDKINIISLNKSKETKKILKKKFALPESYPITKEEEQEHDKIMAIINSY